MASTLADVITCAKFQDEIVGVTGGRLIFAWCHGRLCLLLTRWHLLVRHVTM